MEVGILTYHRVHNYGSFLQAYSLARVLEQHGAVPQFLEFDRNYHLAPKASVRKYGGGIGTVVYGVKNIRRHGLGKTLFNALKMCAMRRAIRSCLGGMRSRDTGRLDLVCIGSDEVFAVDVGFNPVLYGHGAPARSVVSYAGSFGSSSLEDVLGCGGANLIREGLRSMRAVSVRDDNSHAIVSALLGREVPVLCDPVILYGLDEERSRAAASVAVREPFCLVYAYDRNMNDRSEVAAIRRYVHSKGLLLVSVGFYHEWCDRNVVAGPLELAGYFARAECVITDTFHGCVLSVLGGRAFACVRRGRAYKVNSFLSRLGLIGRSGSDAEEALAALQQPVEYGSVNAHLDRQRGEARTFLRDILGRGQELPSWSAEG